MQPSTANLPPQYSQPPPKRTSNQGYFYSIPGIANIGLIVTLFLVIICVAAVVKTPFLSCRSPAENAFLFFAVTAFLIEIIVLVLYLCNVPEKITALPWSFILAVYDAIYAISFFALSITSAVKENDLRASPPKFDQSCKDLTIDNLNYGAFAGAAFFGFISTILFIVHLVFSAMDMLRGGSNAN